MAGTELNEGSKLIYRNIDFNTYGFLNAREAFLKAHPAYVDRVLRQYERARAWILENPDEAAQILADEAKLDVEVAKKVLTERTVLTGSPAPGEEHAEVLRAIIPIFQAENQIKPEVDVEAELKALLAPQFAQQLAQK
jgi:sulfonate transport system substrate-binding protein